jgi:hypothetical protein
MAGRGRHIRGARWSAIGILIAAATAAPQVARADALPAAPSALAQAGLAAAQNAVDTAAAAVSAAQPAVAVPAVPAVAQAAVPTTSAQAAAVSPSAAAQPAAPPAAALAGAVSVKPRPIVPPSHSARAAGTPLPVAESAARAGEDPPKPSIPTGVTAPRAPVRIAPVTAVPMPSMPVVSAAVIATVPTVPVMGVSMPWADGWTSLLTSMVRNGPAPVPMPGFLDSIGWPPGSAGMPVPAALPPALGPWGAGAAPHGAMRLPSELLPQRHAGPGAGRHQARHAASGTPGRSRYRRLVPVFAAASPRAGHVVRSPLHTSAPARLALDRSQQRGMAPRGARSAPEPTSSLPPPSSPVTGGGPAAASAGSAGGAGAAVLLVGAALLTIFLLSTRVSLDMSAWRSTLLSLRLERPG